MLGYAAYRPCIQASNERFFRKTPGSMAAGRIVPVEPA